MTTLKELGLSTVSQPRLRSVGRSIALAAAVGLVAGLGAIIFHLMSQAVLHYALAYLSGYNQGGPLGEAHFFAESEGPFRPWMLLVVPTIGGLISGWLVFTFAPEAEGHGTDAAIDAYHNKRGVIRPIVPIIKMLASAITLGTGGSGGREGPIAQTGAGFGSYLATYLGLSDMERRILLAAGLGAGIGAIFHAPLAGAIFAIEVLYREPDFEAEALIPAFIATTIAYCVFNFLIGVSSSFFHLNFDGFGHLFAVQPGIRFRDPLLLIPLTGLVLVMVVMSLIYVRTFYGIHWTFKRMSVRPTLRPAIGAALTGVVALAAYYGMALATPTAQRDVLSVLSYGYGYLQKMLNAPDGVGLSMSVLLAIGLGKILTTSLTIGSGGSGGVFGPSMVIGGCFGALTGLLFQKIMPGVVTRIDVFVILGMAGFFAAAAKTPVSTLIMVSEMTGSYELLLPSMWVCALAYLFSRGWSIYSEQVPTRLDSPAHRGDFIIDVMQGLKVADAIDAASRQFITIPLDMTLSRIVRIITSAKQTCFPVVDADGNYFGMFSLNDVRQFLYDAEMGELTVAHDLATTGDLALSLDMDLGSAIGKFVEHRFEELPVVDPTEPKRIIAMLRRQDVIAAYNIRLMKLRTSQAD
ncbi:MAG: CBS domain-containing protein [Planctomycetes bacterium]|nr:CBS domain-containing protein [Planctomycetota bacterium]